MTTYKSRPVFEAFKRKTWLFDLDDTLHNASLKIFPLMHDAMMQYMCTHLQISPPEASLLRQTYWRKYEATLLGLVKHHGIDPNHFLATTHNFPELPRLVNYEPGLRRSLSALPGNKIVFSNAPSHYVQAILRIARISRVFKATYGIDCFQFRPKPDLCSFRLIMNKEKIRAKDCVMVEDSLNNLWSAKRLGMKTVWITNQQTSPRFVDLHLHSVRMLKTHLHKLI